MVRYSGGIAAKAARDRGSRSSREGIVGLERDGTAELVGGLGEVASGLVDLAEQDVSARLVGLQLGRLAGMIERAVELPARRSTSASSRCRNGLWGEASMARMPRAPRRTCWPRRVAWRGRSPAAGRGNGAPGSGSEVPVSDGSA